MILFFEILFYLFALRNDEQNASKCFRENRRKTEQKKK